MPKNERAEQVLLDALREHGTLHISAVTYRILKSHTLNSQEVRHPEEVIWAAERDRKVSYDKGTGVVSLVEASS